MRHVTQVATKTTETYDPSAIEHVEPVMALVTPCVVHVALVTFPSLKFPQCVTASEHLDSQRTRRILHEMGTLGL